MRTTLAILLAASTFGLFVDVSAQAQGPRITEINNRLERQSGRVAGAANKHKMTTAQQARADDADYRIAAQEQNMRTKHKGHLTRADQRHLNRELNRNSKAIHRTSGH